jgi:uncharacterized membrane protein
MSIKHQERKITLIITAVSAILVASLFSVGSQLTNNALSQSNTNQSDVAMVENQQHDTNMFNYTGNKTKTPITEINSTEIGIATPTADSLK